LGAARRLSDGLLNQDVLSSLPDDELMAAPQFPG
jgi:hypothetical protein